MLPQVVLLRRQAAAQHRRRLAPQHIHVSIVVPRARACEQARGQADAQAQLAQEAGTTVVLDVGGYALPQAL